MCHSPDKAFFVVVFFFNKKIVGMFLVSPQKHTFWVLSRRASLRLFQWVPTTFSRRNKKNVFLIPPFFWSCDVSYHMNYNWRKCTFRHAACEDSNQPVQFEQSSLGTLWYKGYRCTLHWCTGWSEFAGCMSIIIFSQFIGLDKRGYQANNFLISRRKLVGIH